MNQCAKRTFKSILGCLGVGCFGMLLSAANSLQLSQEANLLSKIHHVNKTEIEIGKLASSKGQVAKVRVYGDRLVRDHKLADQEVLAFATDHEILLDEPRALTAQEQVQMKEEKAAVKRLRDLSGPAFDQAFLTAMEKGHARTIEMLNSAQKQLQPSGIREVHDLGQLVGKLIPILRQHELLANHLEQQVPGGG